MGLRPSECNTAQRVAVGYEGIERGGDGGGDEGVACRGLRRSAVATRRADDTRGAPAGGNKRLNEYYDMLRLNVPEHEIDDSSDSADCVGEDDEDDDDVVLSTLHNQPHARLYRRNPNILRDQRKTTPGGHNAISSLGFAPKHVNNRIEISSTAKYISGSL